MAITPFPAILQRWQRLNLWPRLVLAVTLGFLLLFGVFSLLSLRAVNDSTSRILQERLVIAQMAEAGTELLILTGGEPLLRKGLPVLARHAADKGINVVMGTTGTLLNHQKARALKENGVQGQYPGMMVRARCAPYIGRLAVERGTSLLWSAGCLAGTSYCRITPTGDVTPCPYLPTKAGNVRANHFAQLWETSPVLARLRQPQRQLSGKCGQCLLSQGDEPICVGCRAQAFAIAGDELAADPWCLYHPGRGADKPKSRDNSAPRADVAPATQGQVAWAEAAQARLNRVPLFIRGRVKLAAEAYVRKEGLPEVSVQVLDHLRRRAYGGVS